MHEKLYNCGGGMRARSARRVVPLLFACICVVAIVRMFTRPGMMMTNLSDLVARSTHGVNETSLKPRALFVAWNGVLTLTYEGFPAGLVAVKQRLNQAHEHLPQHLKPENFGSKWPKTTLAAMHDSAPPFTVERLRQLQVLCERHTSKIPTSAVPVSKLSVVQYTARGLENPSSRLDIPLSPRSSPREAEHEAELPCEEERERVRQVLREWDDLDAYLGHVNAPGSRASSYREASPPGHTCVTFWGDAPLDGLRAWLHGLHQEVDRQFPGVYMWLDEASLHCTVRALDVVDQS